MVHTAPQLPQEAASSGLGAEQLEHNIRTIVRPPGVVSTGQSGTAKRLRARAAARVFPSCVRTTHPPALDRLLAVLELPLARCFGDELRLHALARGRTDEDLARLRERDEP